jgi:hypothetical protein
LSKAIASSLSSGLRDTYERWLFLRFAMLTDILCVSDKIDKACENLLKQLSPLDSIKAHDLIKEGTPFFWLNVHLCSLENTRRQKNIYKIIRNLLINAFDSYYNYFPDGSTFSLDCLNDSILTMPRLGIQIPISGNITICRIDQTKLKILILGRGRYFDLNNIESNASLPAIYIPGYKDIKLLMVKDPALFEHPYYESIIPTLPDVNKFANTIGKSLNLIKTVDPAVHARLTSLIKWFVPITPPNRESQNSFTSDKLVGVLFLSDGEKIHVTESIIHEFHRTELHMIMYQQLLRLEDNGMFYSPWSKDPRPLYDLIQGINVFGGVVNFFAKTESISSLKNHATYIRHHIVQIYFQIQLAIAQVPFNHLGPLGRQVIGSIKKDLEHHQKNLGLSKSQLPLNLKVHLKEWCKRNPELAGLVKMPK